MFYYIKKHWKINLLIVFLQILFAGVSVLTNVVMIQMTEGIVRLDLGLFLFWMFVDLGLWILYTVFDGARSWAKSKAKLLMNNEFRADITASLLKKSHSEFHSQQSGEYLSRYTNDINQISSLAWDSFYGIISLGAQVIFSIAALAQMHWSLLAVSVLVAAVMINAPKLFSKRVEKLGEECAAEQAKAMSKLKDLLAGFDVLRFFGKSGRFIEGNHEASQQLEQPRHKLTYQQDFIGEGIDLVNLFCQMGVNLLIGVLSIKGIIIQSALMGGGNLCGTIYGGLAQFGQLRLSIQASKPYFDKITVHSGEKSLPEKIDFFPVCKSLSTENLCFSYGEKCIIKNMNIRFEEGGKYALTGPSGCGKSTLLKLLLGWLPDYSGNILFDDRNAKGLTPEEIQSQISYIEQDVYLFNTTIRENITLGGDFSDEEIEKAVKNSALAGDLESMPLGLDTPVGEDGSALSGGQKQRVAIARALIHRRSILLVDEGTSALDKKNADIVEESLLKNPELTLILVSHHLSPERKAQFTEVYELEPAA
ncbi:MAG: ABC transporter ATP-binding protein [Oscillospiraceae bacterium]|nr:ABC transporter ATP-binding protein [Oscillospiraceae bacterium]